MVENWVAIEDDLDIIHEELDEVLVGMDELKEIGEVVEEEPV